MASARLRGPWDEFIAFVVERASIRQRRAAGFPRPWSQDPVLAVGKFGNVWREADRGTQWELNELRRLAGLSVSVGRRGSRARTASREPEALLLSQLKMVLMYRMCLVPWVTQLLMGGAEPSDLVHCSWSVDPVVEWQSGDTITLEDYHRSLPPGSVRAVPLGVDQRCIVNDCVKDWPGWKHESGGAGPGHVEWRPTTYSSATPEEWAEHVYLHWLRVDEVADKLLDVVLAACSSGGGDARVLMARMTQELPRLCGFKAYEVMTSMTYLEWWPWTEDDLTVVGPGALPALELLLPQADGQWSDEVRLEDARNEAMSRLDWQTGMHWYTAPQLGWQSARYTYCEVSHAYRKFTRRTMEDCLCEWRKYKAVLAGARENRPWPDLVGRW